MQIDTGGIIYLLGNTNEDLKLFRLFFLFLFTLMFVTAEIKRKSLENREGWIIKSCLVRLRRFSLNRWENICRALYTYIELPLWFVCWSWQRLFGEPPFSPQSFCFPLESQVLPSLRTSSFSLPYRAVNYDRLSYFFLLLKTNFDLIPFFSLKFLSKSFCVFFFSKYSFWVSFVFWIWFSPILLQMTLFFF